MRLIWIKLHIISLGRVTKGQVQELKGSPRLVGGIRTHMLSQKLMALIIGFEL